MRTFFIYFGIFFLLALMAHTFIYFSNTEQYTFEWARNLRILAIITSIATIVSYILKKPKNPYNEKANW